MDFFFVNVMPEASQTPGPVLADRPGCHVSSGSLDHPAEPGIMSELPSPREGRGSNSEISTFGVGDGVLMWQSNRVSPAVLQHNCLFPPLSIHLLFILLPFCNFPRQFSSLLAWNSLHH